MRKFPKIAVLTLDKLWISFTEYKKRKEVFDRVGIPVRFFKEVGKK